MSAVVKAVKTVVNAVVDVVEAVAAPVVSVVKKTFQVVGNVVEKVGNAVSSVVNAALNDPIGTIAKVAAVATGNAWALPLIDGATTMAKGGSFGDALKSAAISYATLEGGQFVGNAVGAAAAKAGASATVAKIIGSGVGSSSVAIITGQDPVKAFATGGLAAGVPAMLGQIDGFSALSKSTQNAVANAVTAQMTGRDPTGAVIGGVLQATGIVTDAIKAVDPDGKLSAEQKAVMSNALMSSTIAAVQGKDVSAALARSLTIAGTKALGDMIKSGFASTGSAVATANAELQKTASAMESNVASQKDIAAQFGTVNSQLDAELKTQNDLYSAYTNAKSVFDKDTTDEANYKTAQKALDDYNSFTTSLNTRYNDYYAPTLTSLESKLSTLQNDYSSLVNTSATLNDKLQASIDAANTGAVDAQAATNKEFVEALDPTFDAEAYAKLNGLDATKTDVYEDYLAKGQFEGDVTNYDTYLTNELSKLEEFDKDMYAEDYQAALDAAKSATSKEELDVALNGITNKIDQSVTTEAEATDYLTNLYKDLGMESGPAEDEVQKLMGMDETAAQMYAADTRQLVNALSTGTGKSVDNAYTLARRLQDWWDANPAQPETPSTPLTSSDLGLGDYSLTGTGTGALDEMGGGSGVTAPEFDMTSESTMTPGDIDYALWDSTFGSGEPGLQMPYAPNVPSMGGGQGLTLPVEGGTMTESGLIPPDYSYDLGDPNSFINGGTGGVNPVISVPKTPAPTAATKPTATSPQYSLELSTLLAALSPSGGAQPYSSGVADAASEPVFISDWGGPMDISADFDPTLFRKSSSQTPTQTTKIATGGYLDDLLKLLK